MHVSRALLVTGTWFLQTVAARWVGIPTVPFEESAIPGNFSLSTISSVIVDARYQNFTDTEGETLIPPTLLAFAKTFAEDLASTLGIDVPVFTGNRTKNSVFLTLGEKGNYLDVANRTTSEGYSLKISSDGIIITGASPLGAFWATRTVLQKAALGGSSLSYGSANDAPGWGTRGVMLDVGRQYYPPEFIVELCSYLSFFKQNAFHLHLSDNIYNNADIYTFERSMEIYAAFRPNSNESDVAGLSKRANESYYHSDFEMIQQKCASRGVTIIPELESPGHALVITQWKPELGLEDLSLLNISYPETIPTVQTIWKTFLPWFHSKTVHIGADEYESNLEADYTSFVNTMNSYINFLSGKSMRIWGTFPPSSNATNVNTSVSIQHWEFFEANPYFDFIKNGYSVLNSDDGFYLVGKWSGSYPQHFNLTRIFEGNPAGGAWSPHIFDTKNSTNNPSRDNPNVLGSVAALWNDPGPNATSIIEAYYSLRDGLAPLGDKQWGGDLTRAEYDAVFETLVAAIPAQNLDRKIISRGSTILEYDFSASNSSIITDLSGNGYHGVNNDCKLSNATLFLTKNCSVSTPLLSKGMNYTLSFSYKPSTSTPGALFTGPESSLLLGNGSISNVTLVTSGHPYSLNYTLPVGVWSDVSLIGRGNRTFLSVGLVNATEMEFTALLGINGDSFVWDQPMAILAPLEKIGGVDGEMRGVKLVDFA